MKRTIFIICSIFFATSILYGQKFKPVLVKAGTSVKDYFPMVERYLYPNFTQGKGFFKNGGIIPCMFNYNLLSGEMEFIQSKDTLIIAKKEEINSIVVAQDTFYYHYAYLQQIRSGPLSVYIKRGLEIKDILKQGAMGTVNRSSASDSYNFVLIGQRTLDLKPAEDIVLQKTEAYFYSTSGNFFVHFNRKNLLKIMPTKEYEVKYYIKSNKTNFDSGEDLLKLADFVSRLLYHNPKKS